MWLKNDQFQKIGVLLNKGHSTAIDRSLAQILDHEDSGESIPLDCPQCHRDLVRRALPYLELFISACPQKHGVWMSPQVWQSLKSFMMSQLSVANQRKNQLVLMSRLSILSIVASFTLCLMAYGPKQVSTTLQYHADQRLNNSISETNWPIRHPEDFTSIPIKESVINYHDELVYFQNLCNLLEEGLSNRLNIDGVLKSKRTAEQYESLYYFYITQQTEFLMKLTSLSPSSRLETFHQSLIVATEAQMSFYTDYTDQKMMKASTHLKDLMGHTSLKNSSSNLHRAYEMLFELYPNLDVPTQKAIERRLCWFDIV